MTEYNGPEGRQDHDRLLGLEIVVEQLTRDVSTLTTTVAKFTKIQFMIMGGATAIMTLVGTVWSVVKLFF